MLISLDNVTFSYTGTPVFENVCFAVNEGERIGFIGGNGEGKTTLLKVMLGILPAERGTVNVKSGARIGYLEQSGGFENAGTVYSAMQEVFARDRQILDELARVQEKMAGAEGSALHELLRKAEVLEKEISARDSYHSDVKIKTVLNGMGFQERYGQMVSTMSGGEKTKLKLCRLLLEEPDLLVLDEPTNHLDLSTLFWLEEYLNTYHGALLIVSHDRYFLDRLTTRTVEMEHGALLLYKGNYSKYKVLKEERLKEAWREYEKQCERAAKLKDYIDRNLVRATTAKSAQSRVKQLDKLEYEKPVPPKMPPRFHFIYDTPPYERVLHAPDVTLTAGGKTLLSHTEFTLMRGEKCALVGDNGTGKSTLLKFLLSGDKGVSFAKFVKTSYYDQENATLDETQTALDELRFRFPLFPLTDAYKLLAQSGIDADDAAKRVCELSGGLKAKLSLAVLQAEKGNFLILDEPTNHLDLLSREALETALRAYDGTLLFVSHDRRFIESIATDVIAIEDGTLNRFHGSYPAYLESKKQAETQKPAPAPVQKSDESYRSRRERARETQKRTRIREIENALEALEREEATLNEKLALVAADYEQVKTVTARLTEIHSESETLYEEYATLI